MKLKRILTSLSAILPVLLLTACAKTIPQTHTEAERTQAAQTTDAVPEATERIAFDSEAAESSVFETESPAVSSAEMPETTKPEEQEEPNMTDTNRIRVEIGGQAFTFTLADNPSAAALRELLADGPRTISCSNYGGFEKVCRLGAALPSNDVQTTTRAGDVMLYSSNQIVFFHASNSWAYTRLGTVDAEYIGQLQSVLSGTETELTLSLMEEAR